jgi:hypothetical protein
MLTIKGREYIANAILGLNDIPFDFTNAMIGVGSSSIEAFETQTDLLGTHKLRKGMDSGYPKISELDSSLMIFKATFENSEANFAWEEWGVFNGDTANDVMLVREVEQVGIKETGTLWRFTVSIKFINNI